MIFLMESFTQLPSATGRAVARMATALSLSPSLPLPPFSKVITQLLISVYPPSAKFLSRTKPGLTKSSMQLNTRSRGERLENWAASTSYCLFGRIRERSYLCIRTMKDSLSNNSKSRVFVRDALFFLRVIKEEPFLGQIGNDKISIFSSKECQGWAGQIRMLR